MLGGWLAACMDGGLDFREREFSPQDRRPGSRFMLWNSHDEQLDQPLALADTGLLIQTREPAGQIRVIADGILKRRPADPNFATPEATASWLGFNAGFRRAFMRKWVDDLPHGAILIDHRDLVARPHESLGRALTLFGLEADPDRIARVLANVAKGPTPAASLADNESAISDALLADYVAACDGGAGDGGRMAATADLVEAVLTRSLSAEEISRRDWMVDDEIVERFVAKFHPGIRFRPSAAARWTGARGRRVPLDPSVTRVRSISIPRSGHQFLTRMIGEYLGDGLDYRPDPIGLSEVRERAGVLMWKSHDGDLADPLDCPGTELLIQTREPVGQVISEAERHVRRRDAGVHFETRRGVEAWLAVQAGFRMGFHDKWVSHPRDGAVVTDYGDLKANPEAQLARVLEAIGVEVDEARVAMAVETSRNFSALTSAPYRPRPRQSSSLIPDDLLADYAAVCRGEAEQTWLGTMAHLYKAILTRSAPGSEILADAVATGDAAIIDAVRRTIARSADRGSAFEAGAVGRVPSLDVRGGAGDVGS